MEKTQEQKKKQFTIEKGKEVLRLKVGRYSVIEKIADESHSGMWGTFSDTIVENESGERFSIPTGNAQLLGLI